MTLYLNRQLTHLLSLRLGILVKQGLLHINQSRQVARASVQIQLKS